MGQTKGEIDELMETFSQKHGALVQAIIETVNQMVREHDGDSLLLFRRYLENMIALIDERMGAKTTRVKAGEN